ncbi:MAG: hypothetical protein CMJ48_10755 [Planctomycetaceae bacterium]|nr:hypothetical protein [Planctomycetaceae bacterium]
MNSDTPCGVYQWIIKRDLGEDDLASALNHMARNGTEVFQILSVPRGNGCRFLIVGRRQATGEA